MNEFTVLSLAIASAGISAMVTAAYWREKHYAILRQIAAERRADANAINNARIVEQVYGSTLGLDIQEGRR